MKRPEVVKMHAVLANMHPRSDGRQPIYVKISKRTAVYQYLQFYIVDYTGALSWITPTVTAVTGYKRKGDDLLIRKSADVSPHEHVVDTLMSVLGIGDWQTKYRVEVI